MLFSDVFEIKRHKNLDRHNKHLDWAQNEIDSVPSTVFNPFFKKQQTFNTCEDWPLLTEEQIESENQRNWLIREIPKS